jgi:Arc/MetJ-type ribon-helix-helix transcriptional regulator
LTQNHVHGTQHGVGRRKLWHENINLTLPEGAKARMDAALKDGEDRLDLIREAIERELERRGRAAKKAK